MKAVAICGSPREAGNTEFLLRHCLRKIKEEGIGTEFVPLHGKLVKGCAACGGCDRTKDKTCSVKDDDFGPILEKMLEADIIVVGSPVYCGSATAQIVATLQRAAYVSRANGRLFSRKLGGPIIVGRRAGQNFTYAQLLYWYMINNMIVPGSTYWNIAFGNAPGEVEKDEEGLRTVQRFAENLVWLAEKTRRSAEA